MATSSALSPTWFCARNRQKFGPFTLAQVRQLIASGKLTPDDMLLREGTAAWVRAGSVQGLFPASSASPAVKPAPSASLDETIDNTPSVSPAGSSPAGPRRTGAVLTTGDGQNPPPAPSAGAKQDRLTEADTSAASGMPPSATALLKTATTSPSVKPAATVVPGYEILDELGRGGMGVVYKARQKGLNRVVALKMVLSGAFAGTQERLRFKTEAEAVARLQHPNIVQIYDIGESDGRPYFSLEFVSGGCLARHLDGTPLPPRQVAQVVQHLARAMHFAHQRDIIHRDLKPANILLAPDPSAGPLGIPKITDFGLAKQMDSNDGQTHSGAVLGTPSYMSPEQASGRHRELGPATDIYALGAILYELLTGRPPFRGETAMDTMFQLVSEEPVPPSRLQPKVPRDLETICLKCLQKQPHKRYSSAEQLAEDLDLFLKGEAIRARPIATWERALKWTWKRPAAAGLIAVSSLAALLLIFGGWSYSVRLKSALNVADQQRVKAEQSAEDARLHAEEARRQETRAKAGFQSRVEELDNLITRMDARLAKAAGNESLRMEFLMEFLRSSENLLKENPTDPSARHQTGLIHRLMGDLEVVFKDQRAAETSFGKAIALQTPLATEFPAKTTYRSELALTIRHRARSLSGQRRYAEAQADYQKAIALLDQMATQPSDQRDYREQAASCRSDAARVYVLMAQPRQAEQAYQKAQQLQERLVTDFPDRASVHSQLANTLRGLARVQGQTQPTQAQTLLERALKAQRRALELEPSQSLHRRQLAGCYKELSAQLRRNNQQTELARLDDDIRRDFPDGLDAAAGVITRADLAIGKPAPEIQGEDTEGQRLRLSDHRGKVVVLDFWANWCGYCRQMYPQERLIVQKMKGRPFALLGINCDEDRGLVKRVVQKENINWRSWHDGRRGPICQEWQINAFPTIFVLDHKGVIRYQNVRGKALDDAVDRLVREAERK